MSIAYWLILIAALIALWYAGLLRPTGLWSRTREDEEKDRQRDAAARLLKKDAERTDKPPE